jgi:Fic family protein
MELALLTLREVEQYVDSWERRDNEMREVLRKDPLLNQRQRAILARALRVPDAEFNIRYHKRNHNVAYTTARRDLLELADKGYLSMEQRGKAFIFAAAPKLQELVREHATS